MKALSPLTASVVLLPWMGFYPESMQIVMVSQAGGLLLTVVALVWVVALALRLA